MEPSDVPDSSANVLYVGNLDKRVTDVMMTNILRTGLPHIADNILSAKMFAPSDPMNGPEGYCFVHFSDNNSACQAMTFLNGREFCGKKVKVNWATNSNTNGGMPKIIGSSVTIFVGDLDDEITDSELRQAFDPFGEILWLLRLAKLATNKLATNTYQLMANPLLRTQKLSVMQLHRKAKIMDSYRSADAEKAIRDMHGAMLRRRPIKTNWATRNQKTQPSTLDYDQVYKEANEDNSTVYVTNLPDRITDDVITEHFKPYGTILGRPRLFEGKNFCFIKYDTHAAAATAIVKGNGSELNGAVLKCWWGKDNAGDIGGVTNNSPSSNYPSNSSSNYSNQRNSKDQQQNQYQQYMNYYNNPYYQQYYYQQWMQQYQMMQQQQQQNGAAAQQVGQQYTTYPYQYQYPQQPQGGEHPQSPPQNYN